MPVTEDKEYRISFKNKVSNQSVNLPITALIVSVSRTTQIPHDLDSAAGKACDCDPI